MEKKTYSVYVHKVDTDNGPLYYTGVTKDIKQRWIPSGYKKDTSLGPYIEQYGWENIEHIVVFETDDREKALKTEDTLICGYAALGRCINKHRSGLIEVSDKKAYDRQWFASNPEFAERRYQYYRERRANDHEWAEQQRQYCRDRYSSNPEFAERQRQYERKKRATPEGKIYERVRTFNRYHPDLAIETPKEARDKYIATGYIPQYIKHDDL